MLCVESRVSAGNSDILADRDYSVDLIVVIRIQAQLPRDDLTLFTLHQDAGGCSKLVPLLPPFLFFAFAVHFCKHFSF